MRRSRPTTGVAEARTRIAKTNLTIKVRGGDALVALGVAKPIIHDLDVGWANHVTREAVTRARKAFDEALQRIKEQVLDAGRGQPEDELEPEDVVDVYNEAASYRTWGPVGAKAQMRRRTRCAFR